MFASYMTRQYHHLIIYALIVGFLLYFYGFFVNYGWGGVKPTFLEGMETEQTTNSFKEYDTDNPDNALILAQQNAGNIAYLKDRLDEDIRLQQQVDDLSANVQDLQKQLNDVMAAQEDFTRDAVGDTPPEITGAVEEEEDENLDADIDTV